MRARHLLLIVPLLLSGCGFHLRGTLEMPPDWLAMHLRSPSPHGELTRQVRAALANAGVQWLDAGSANYTLQLGVEHFEQRNLTIAANARAAEFELQLSTTLGVRDRNGVELLPPSRVSSTRIMAHDPEKVSGKAEETDLTRAEMRVELVQQILRRIRFLATR